MAIKLSVVTSLNGLTTKGNEGPSHWASPEDQQKFAKLKSEADVVAFGSNTYREMRSIILGSLTEAPMRAVIRRRDDFRWDTVPGKLEFFSSIDEFLDQMQKQKKVNILLASGAALTGEFFRRGLIDEVHHTIEPLIFESGLPIAEGVPNLRLQKKSETVPLNEGGTIYTVYNVIKELNK
jgi:dihydrofolate reductase